jgi:hypothetical protein
MKAAVAAIAVAVLAAVVLAAIPIWAQSGGSTLNYEWTGYQGDAYYATMKGVFNDKGTGTDVTFSLPIVYQPFLPQNTYVYPESNQNWTFGGWCGSGATLSFTKLEQDGITTDNPASSVSCTNTFDSGTGVLTTRGTFSGTNALGVPFIGTLTVENGRACHRGCLWNAFDVKWSVNTTKE